MNNDIITKQNNEKNLFKLAAMRRLYSIGKLYMGIQIVLGVPIVIVLALLPIILTDAQLNAIHLNKNDLNLFIVAYSIIISLIDYLYINPSVTKYKQTAACIQEDFDYTVLALPWNEIKESCPDNEDISKYAHEYKKKQSDLSALNNWYSPIALSSLPLPVARIICQRTNCWWDSHLRRKFKRDLKISTVVLLFILIVISIAGGFTVSKLVTNVIFPFLPALIFSMRHIQENTLAIEGLEKRKNKADELWAKILREPLNFNGLEDLSRKLQDEIFESRKNSPLSF